MLSFSKYLFGGLVMVAALSSSASASPMETFGGSLSFSDTSPLLNNPVYFTGSFANAPFSFTGGVGSTYTDLLTVTGLDASLLSNRMFSDNIAVDILFNLPGLAGTTIGGSGSITDTFHLRGFYYADSGEIAWSGPATIDFADGAELSLALDNITLSGVNGISTGSGNLTMTVEKTDPVPEPLTLSLFGAGMAGIAAARRRKAAKA